MPLRVERALELEAWSSVVMALPPFILCPGAVSFILVPVSTGTDDTARTYLTKLS